MVKTREKALTEIELEEFLKAAETPKQKIIANTLAYTGMRVSEYVHFTPDWIDWQNLVIKIPSEVECTKHPECIEERHRNKKLTKKANIWTPKTKAGARTIPIEFEPRLKGVLREFESHLKDPTDRISIFRMVKRLASKAGLKKIVTPHVLRATFASMLASKGMSAGSLQALMGWERLDTAQHYIKASGVNVAKELRAIW